MGYVGYYWMVPGHLASKAVAWSGIAGMSLMFPHEPCTVYSVQHYRRGVLGVHAMLQGTWMPTWDSLLGEFLAG